MHSLLHISDLHRSPDEPIDNDTLLASIFSDIDRFSSVNQHPSAIIVSGDLVQGVRIGHPNYNHEMACQYDTAFDLIKRLCDELLDGDRSQVVIVSGNHDICWNSSLEAIEPVASDQYPKDLRQSLAQRDSPFRWSWNEQRLYRIKDQEIYKNRLDSYWNAVESFYENVQLPLPIDRNRGFQLYRIFDGRMIIAGFESTHRNDHLRYEAELSTGIISRCALHLRKINPQPSLLGAVWHHSVHGPPSKEDYLNIEHIREMTGLGFQIGFHGHQHIADSTDLAVSIGGGATMCIVSAGSLCASGRELPRGTDRQYNIINIENCLTRGTLHVREMAEGNQFVGRTRGRFIDGQVPLSWSPRSGGIGNSADFNQKRLRFLTLEIEEACRKGTSTPLTKELLSINPPIGSYSRSILLQALLINQDWAKIIEFFWPSSSIEEAVAAAEAAFKDKNLLILEEVISSKKLPDTYVPEFQTRLDFLKLQKRQ